MSDPRNSPGILPLDATDPRGAAAYSQLYQLPWAQQPQVGYQPPGAGSPQVGYQPPERQSRQRKSDVPRPQSGAFTPGDWIKHWEGVDWTPNDDGYGNPTLGYGHLITHEESRRGYIDTPGGRIPTRGWITPQQAEALFQFDYQNSLRDLQGVPGFSQLNPNQQEAVISYYFNTGDINNISRALASGNPQTIGRFIQHGIQTAGGGRPAPVLARRRGEEAQLFGAPPQGGPSYGGQPPPQAPAPAGAPSQGGGLREPQISTPKPPYYRAPGGGLTFDPTRAPPPPGYTSQPGPQMPQPPSLGPGAPTPAPTEPVTREPLPAPQPTLPPETFGVPSMWPPYRPPTWSRGPQTTELPPPSPVQPDQPGPNVGTDFDQGGPGLPQRTMPSLWGGPNPYRQPLTQPAAAPSPDGGAPLVTGLPPLNTGQTPPLPPTQPGPGVTDGGDQAAPGPGGTAAKAAPPKADDGMLPGGPPFPNVGRDRGQPQQQPADQPSDQTPPSQPVPPMETAGAPAWDYPAPPEPVGYSGRTGGVEPGRGPQDALPSGAGPQMAVDPGGERVPGMPQGPQMAGGDMTGPAPGQEVRTLATQPDAPPSAMPATPGPGGTPPTVPAAFTPAPGAGASAPAGGLEGGGGEVPAEGGPDLGGGGGQVAEPLKPYSHLPGGGLVPGGAAPGQQAPAQAPSEPGQDIGFGPGNLPVTFGRNGYDPQNPLSITFGVTEAGRDYRAKQQQRMDEANQRMKEADDLLASEDPERAKWRDYYNSRIAAKEEAATAMRNLMLHPPHRNADDTFQAIGSLSQAMGMMGGSMGMVSGAGAIRAMAAAIRATTARNDADFKDSMETWKSEANMAYQLFNMENGLKRDALEAYGTDPRQSITKVGDALQRIAIRFGNNKDLQNLATSNFDNYLKSFKAQGEAIDAYWSTTLSGIQKLNFMHAYDQGLDEAAAKLSPQERAVNMQQWPEYRGAPPSAALEIFNKNFESTAMAGVPGFAGKGYGGRTGRAGIKEGNFTWTGEDGQKHVGWAQQIPGIGLADMQGNPIPHVEGSDRGVSTAAQQELKPYSGPDRDWPGWPSKPPPGDPDITPAVWSQALLLAGEGRPVPMGRSVPEAAAIRKAYPLAQLALGIDPASGARSAIDYKTKTAMSESIARGFANGWESQNMASLNMVAGHIQTFRDYAIALKNHSSPVILNRILQDLRVQLGDPRITNFNIAATVMADEVVRLLTRTGGTEADRQGLQSQINRGFKEEQLLGAADTFTNLVRERFDAMRTIYVSPAGDDPTDREKRTQLFNTTQMNQRTRQMFVDTTKEIPPGTDRPGWATGRIAYDKQGKEVYEAPDGWFYADHTPYKPTQ